MLVYGVCERIVEPNSQTQINLLKLVQPSFVGIRFSSKFPCPESQLVR